jgi:fumarate reductase subunit D
MSVQGQISGSRAHAGFLAALVHRISGLALAIFLPFHFLVLGLALEAESFNAVIAWTDQPLVKVSEVLLVSALAVHFAGGLRLLAVEFLGLNRALSFWIAVAFAVGAGGGLLFAMSMVG